VERRGDIVQTVIKQYDRKRTGQRKGSIPKSLMMMIGIMYFLAQMAPAFIVIIRAIWWKENYSLLEPDACLVSDRNGETETTVYGEIVQMNHLCAQMSDYRNHHIAELWSL
jgi:hypothetical protein